MVSPPPPPRTWSRARSTGRLRRTCVAPDAGDSPLAIAAGPYITLPAATAALSATANSGDGAGAGDRCGAYGRWARERFVACAPGPGSTLRPHDGYVPPHNDRRKIHAHAPHAHWHRNSGFRVSRRDVDRLLAAAAFDGRW